MSASPSRPSSAHLEPPPKTVELEDPGAHESGSEDEHFSDASEGRSGARSQHSSALPSPVPRTRVEKVDDEPRYGEVPGTDAYNARVQDAVPDEVEIVPEGSHSRRGSSTGAVTPGGTPIPRTVVVKVDPNEPSYGEVPGTEAYEARCADAVPDAVVAASDDGREPAIQGHADQQNVPETLLTRVDTPPHEPESPRLRSYSQGPDAAPDATETVQDTIGDDDFGDDFDEFEEGAAPAGPDDDDFGEFDEGFQAPGEETTQIAPEQPAIPTTPAAPLLDFSNMSSLSDLMSATNDTLDSLFPETATLSTLPPVEPIPDSSAIFNSERSYSLWTQLVAPPPLQPPNWVKSRIRRLFLVSLGVPVDLDEILPASKQKKLVLPSIDSHRRDSSSGRSPSRSPHRQPTTGDAAGTQQQPSSTDAAAQGKSSTSTSSSRRRGPPPPPELDLSALRRLCATTQAALDGMTDDELRAHVRALYDGLAKATEAREYWQQRRDALQSEKEAFEGVIENLVNHARRVRR